jgi:hypothetical protein
MSFGEVSLGLFRLFLLINPFGRVEHPIYKTLESVIVSGLVLSLRVENTDAIQEALKFTWSGSVLLVASRSLHHVDGMIHFSLLAVALDELGWFMWPKSFLCSLVSRVTSSTRVYLLAIANICSDVLEFFMVSLQINNESLSPFLKNIIIDLSSTSGMRFLLLQKRWINSQSDCPLFWTTLAKSNSTPGCVHVAQKLLLNRQHRRVQERTNPEESPRSHVLADECR